MQTSQTKLDFGAAVASSVHDIKNSLGLMLYTVDDLLEQTSEQESGERKSLNELRFEARRINQELVHLLSLFKFERGMQKLRVDHVDLEEFALELKVSNQPMLSIKGIEFQLAIEAAAQWFFDRELILGLVGTVINNAYRHARECVELRCAIEGEELVIRVLDDGSGFAPEQIGVVNSASGIKPSSGSTGLGLYFAALVAQMHKNGEREGRVELSNLDAGGACFALFLP